jgi:required for meiotic nuclear division protein 1
MLYIADKLLTSGKTEFNAHALYVGEGIEIRAFDASQRARVTSLVVEMRGGGLAVLFRYGVIVVFDASPADYAEFFREVIPRVRQPFSESERETETLQIRIDPPGKESVSGETVVLNDLSSEKLQLVADVLAKSVALARYENSVAQQFDRIEPFASDLANWNKGNRSAHELLQHLGGAMLSEHKIVGGAQVDDTPELLWDHPELERLWARLRDEFEIRTRYVALQNKLALISRTAETALNLLQDHRSYRVEWYVVGLIILEIVITLLQWIVFGMYSG